jgi:hypothetical protein
MLWPIMYQHGFSFLNLYSSDFWTSREAIILTHALALIDLQRVRYTCGMGANSKANSGWDHTHSTTTRQSAPVYHRPSTPSFYAAAAPDNTQHKLSSWGTVTPAVDVVAAAAVAAGWQAWPSSSHANHVEPVASTHWSLWLNIYLLKATASGALSMSGWDKCGYCRRTCCKDLHSTT